jgi:hypothetical protein
MQRILDRRLNETVKRNRILLLDVVSAELGVDAELLLDLLTHHRHLQLLPFAGGVTVVTNRAKGRPSDVAIARAVAMQRFCQREPTRPRILSPESIETYFPSLFRKGLPFGYYVRNAGLQPVLGLLRVDTHLKPVARLMSKSDSIAQRHFKQQEFRQLQRTGQFELTWLVPTEAKKRSLEIAVANLSSLSFTLRAFAVPEVLEILAPLQLHHSPTLRV